MGESPRIDAARVPQHKVVSERGNVWPDQPDSSRCASIGANIAEGCGRKGNPELGRFLQIAMGSASEVEYHILLARDLGMLSANEYKQLNARVIELKRMLSTLINSLKAEDATRNAREMND